MLQEIKLWFVKCLVAAFVGWSSYFGLVAYDEHLRASYCDGRVGFDKQYRTDMLPFCREEAAKQGIFPR